ncbi:MAG: 4Fe-4S binding protein, partial [Bacteroidota bacterium]|nr:4Fe-4S binding protein [Bacteroidota bacterium]
MTKLFLKRFRQTLAIVVFVLITLLFLDFTGVLHKYFSFLAKIQLLPAIMALNFVVVALLIVLTLIFGRIYCSVICPLGIMQDVFSHLHTWRKKNRFRFAKEYKILRYSVFVLFIVVLLLGINSLAILLAPYSSYGRMVQNLFSPIYLFFNNILAYFAARLDSYTFYSQEIYIRSISTFVIALVSFLVIGFLAWKKGRLYCNSICPVGTLLSFFAKFSFFKIRIEANKCIKCDKCTRNCKAECINGKENFVDYSRCVVCGNCQATCPKK